MPKQKKETTNSAAEMKTSAAMSLVEKKFDIFVAHLDQPLSENAEVDHERINALRLITRYLHSNSSSWKQVFDYAIRGEQSADEGSSFEATVKENAALKAVLKVLKDEYKRLQEDYQRASELNTGDKKKKFIEGVVNRLSFGGQSAVAVFVAASYCMTTSTPLVQAAPWAIMMATGFIRGIRGNNQISGLINGAGIAMITGWLFIDNLPYNHIVELAKHEISASHTKPAIGKMGIVKERIPLEINEKFFAGKYLVTDVNVTTTETCVDFDLVPFDTATVGSRVTLIKRAKQQVCFTPE